MAKRVRILTALTVRSLNKSGMHGDGNGLYLQISKTGTKSWVFRYTLRGKARTMGLGPCDLVSLAEARDLATRSRKQCLDGIDPIDERKKAQTPARSKTPTFAECAAKYIAIQRPSWRNGKHADQWSNTLQTYAYPVFGSKPVDQIDRDLVLKVLEPIWATKAETAGRVRMRIESILDWAAVSGYRTGENPAHWKGHLQKLLPPKSRVRRVKHHPALPYSEIRQFYALVEKQAGTAAIALRFLILTAARTNEILGADWREIDLAARSWIIPANRMKAGKEHRVPLSKAAIEILTSIGQSQSGPIFTSAPHNRPLSNAAMLVLLKRMKRPDITVHGFRSTFRDWIAETTAFPAEMAEIALAHTVSDKVEAAYRRGDMFERRREMMEAWAKHVVNSSF